jgi:predicted RNase H-like nuclease
LALIAGVDGCKAGWIAIRLDTSSGKYSSEIFSSGSQLINQSLDHEALALDIPIGLTNSGPRQCDLLARKMLGPRRGSSVFPAPIRPALDAPDRLEADRIARAIQGKGVGAQAFALYARIRDVDDSIRGNEQARRIVHEVHPEICFMAWNDGNPIVESKKSFQGMRMRFELIESHFGESSVEAIRQKYPPSLVADDDINDAFAALWTAQRIDLGTAVVIPDPPEIDPLGLRMGMWY